ncbi:hypothetical protein E2C01_014819 [Portunus trituberculatus]|uniref:Ig-like domain-containing protein n=1 Tax=Portunus trituberculatus TaxID=210409 RepID=A0A5B7DL74_PORTR|nr:hypothetical protein [Portunus trituberculatus]
MPEILRYCVRRGEESLMPCSPADKPVVTLQMGSNLDPEAIKEGDDVYFECHINANPDVQKVLWYHNLTQCLSTRRHNHPAAHSWILPLNCWHSDPSLPTAITASRLHRYRYGLLPNEATVSVSRNDFRSYNRVFHRE